MENQIEKDTEMISNEAETETQPEEIETEQEKEEAEQEIKMMHDTMYHTNPWDENFPSVFSSTTHREMKNNPNLEQLRIKAKSGDLDAAYEYTNSIVDTNIIASMKEKFPNAIVCPVIAEESTGNNMIPVAYAEFMKNSGFSVTTDIKQSVRAHHTGANSIQRFVNRVRFSGEVEKGKEYILIDDHVDYGGTLRDLKDFIESNGGKVVAFSTLTSITKDTKILPDKESVDKLNEYGGTIDELLRQFGITDNKAGLTDGETKSLLKILSNTSRDRKFGSRSQEIFGLLCQQASDELKAKRKQEEKTRPVLNRFIKISSRLTPQEQQELDQKIKEIISAINSGNKDVAAAINSFTPSKNNKETDQYITLIEKAHNSIEPTQKQPNEPAPQQKTQEKEKNQEQPPLDEKQQELNAIFETQKHFNELYPELAEHSLPELGYDSNGHLYVGYSDHDATIIPEFKMEVDGEEKTFKNFYLKKMDSEDGKSVYTVTDGKQELKLPQDVMRRISDSDYVKSYYDSVDKEFAEKKLDANKDSPAPVSKDVFIRDDEPSYQSYEGEGWDKIGDDDYYDYLESPEGQARMLSESESISQEQSGSTQIGKTGIFVNKLSSFLRDNPYASYEDYKEFYDKNYNLTPAKLETKIEFSDGKFNKAAITDVNGYKSKQDATFVSTMRQMYSRMDREGWDYLSNQFSPDANKDSLESAKSALKEFKDNLNTQSLWQKEQENISTLKNLQAKYARYTTNTGKEAWDSFREGLDIKENRDAGTNVTIKLFDFSDETKYPPDDPLTPQKKQDALNALIGKELPKMNSGISTGNVYQGEILEDYVIAGYDELGDVTKETEAGPVTRKTYDYSTVVIEKTDEDGNTQTRHLPLRAIENALTVRTRAEREAQQELTATGLEENIEIKEDKLQAIKEKLEDQLGIGQDELRLNSAANFVHNFIIRCNNEGFNTGECLQIAKESYSQLNDAEKKKFVQQKELYERQHGEKYEYFLIREYKKNREPFTHTPSPFYPTSVVAPLYGNEVREKKGTPVSVGSKVCVGDEFNMTLSYKSVFEDENSGEKNDKPIVVSQKFRVASTNPINNCVVLVSEDGKEAHTIPCDTFLKKAEKAKEKQIKKMNKIEKRQAKEKKSEFSLSIG